MTAEKKKRGARLPFGKLTGVWTELAQTLRGLKDGTVQPEPAKARCYVLQTMLGVVDREHERRALDTMQAEIATMRAAFATGNVIATTARHLPASGVRSDA
ncbi:MAG TPA: hypothetical protein VF994_00115 [Myxococcales bacterium]